MRVRDARTENRFFVDNIIIRQYGKDLGPIGIATYTALCMHARVDTQVCFPSHATVAEEIGASVSAVKRALIIMKDMGLVTWDRGMREDGGYTSNTYVLLDPPSSVGTIPQLSVSYGDSSQGATNNPKKEQSSIKTPAQSAGAEGDDGNEDSAVPGFQDSIPGDGNVADAGSQRASDGRTDGLAGGTGRASRGHQERGGGWTDTRDDPEVDTHQAGDADQPGQADGKHPAPVVYNLDDVAYTMEGTGQRKDELTAYCPNCGATHTQEDNTCPDCNAPVVWLNSPTWKKRYTNPKTYLRQLQGEDLKARTPLETEVCLALYKKPAFANVTQQQEFRALRKKYPDAYILEMAGWAKGKSFAALKSGIENPNNYDRWQERQQQTNTPSTYVDEDGEEVIKVAYW